MSEATPKAQENLRVLLRFLGGLTLLRRLLPGVLLLIVLASSTPQIFLWAIGEYVQCGEPTTCTIRWLGHPVPLSLTLLAAVAIAGITFRTLAWAAFELTGMWSTCALHDRMIAALARARTTYFDETPSGHLINRITGDFGNLRFMGVIRIGDATNALVEVFATMVLVMMVNPWAGLLVLPVTAAFVKIQLDIGPMLGHAEEIGSAAMGELVHRETDLIEGRGIFALYGRQKELLHQLHAACVRLTDARLLSARLQAWSRVWTRVLAALYGFVVFVCLTLAIEDGRLSLTLAAVVVSALFALSGSFGWLTWCLAFLTETLGNARRVFEIVDLPGEESEEHAAPRPAATLVPVPRGGGDLVFDRLVAGYRPGGGPVLHGLTLEIARGEKVGLVGRTGAGKSSVVQVLFRMVNVHAGDVRFGGSSIYAMDVTDLRSAFGVVPQSPYLFKGTVKENLDRFARASDAEVRRVLERVELPLLPDAPVEESGRNLSLGERQLLCLARILLADKPVVLMDEPTSAVDLATDAKIQRLLLTELGGRTVITIAHRLESLAGYDRVVELAFGQVARTGRPEDFLRSLPGGPETAPAPDDRRSGALSPDFPSA